MNTYTIVMVSPMTPNAAPTTLNGSVLERKLQDTRDSQDAGEEVKTSPDSFSLSVGGSLPEYLVPPAGHGELGSHSYILRGAGPLTENAFDIIDDMSGRSFS